MNGLNNHKNDYAYEICLPMRWGVFVDNKYIKLATIEQPNIYKQVLDILKELRENIKSFKKTRDDSVREHPHLYQY